LKEASTTQMSTTTHSRSSTINFRGKSGERYRFQAWPIDTKFEPVGGIYIVTKRECLDRTFPTKATHHCLAIGQTADLAASAFTEDELSKFRKQGANCICVCALADELGRLAIEKDLIEGNEQWGGGLYYLFHPVVAKAAGVSGDS
jgi:hypothetical protein